MDWDNLVYLIIMPFGGAITVIVFYCVFNSFQIRSNQFQEAVNLCDLEDFCSFYPAIQFF